MAEKIVTTAGHTSFLNAIRDNLADDAPRLIYADWLDENGEADRAALIRVQCRIYQLTCQAYSEEDCDWDKCTICPERKELRRRELEILSTGAVFNWLLSGR